MYQPPRSLPLQPLSRVPRSNEWNAWKLSRATERRINGMQFEPPRRAGYGSYPAIDSHRGRNRDEGQRVQRGTIARFTWPITILRRERWAVLSYETRAQRSPLSITLSLSRNGPVRPLDFTLRSRYKTISISFAKGLPGAEDFLRYFPWIRRSPRTTLSHPLRSPPPFFTPRPTHIASIDVARTRRARLAR